MELSAVVECMRCPACKSPELRHEDGEVACSSCGHQLPVDGKTVTAVSSTRLSDEWEEMQAGSVERYADEHYEEDETIARIFGGFIAVTLKPDDVVLDVGCGLFENKPAYVRELEFGGYIGLEPLLTNVRRDYSCVKGAVAEDLPFRDGSIDAIVSATSLDHIMDVDAAIAELKRVLTPGGRIYFWVGLREPEMLARAKSFHSIFFGGSGPKRAVRIAAAYPEYALFLYRLWSRRRKLERGIPLDNAHCRYYTRERLFSDLERWGLEARRPLLIPGSTSILVEAIPR